MPAEAEGLVSQAKQSTDHRLKHYRVL